MVLDAVGLHALGKAPEHWYSGDTVLPHDLQRNWSGELVGARPAHLTFRFTKFMLKNRTWVAAAATPVRCLSMNLVSR